MASTESPRTLRPGQPAPDFTLPAADRDGTVSLSDYRGRSPVLLALFRGLYCPFCRRQIVQLADSAKRLATLGIATLGVVATAAERTRLYFRFRPPRIPMAADPDLTTHRAYGLPWFPFTPEIMADVDAAATEMARQLGASLSDPAHAYEVIERFDGFEPLESDKADLERHRAQLIGQFLVDRDGIIRWANIERRTGDFPGSDDLLAAAREL